MSNKKCYLAVLYPSPNALSVSTNLTIKKQEIIFFAIHNSMSYNELFIKTRFQSVPIAALRLYLYETYSVKTWVLKYLSVYYDQNMVMELF